MAAIHIGKRIKEAVDNSHFTVTEFADRINKSRTVVYDIFERNTIDTGLLHKIGKVLDHDFFSYYNMDTAWIAKEGRGNYILKNEILSNLNSEIISLKKQMSELEKKYELLEKVNKLLEEKMGVVKRKKKG